MDSSLAVSTVAVSTLAVSTVASSAVASAGDAIVTVDATAKVTSWNHAAERLFGRAASAMIGQGLAVIIPEEFRPRHVAAFHAALDSGKLAHDGQPARIEGIAADGTVVPLEMTLGLLRDDAGKPTGVVAVLRQRATPAISFI
jgi:PAS domain S-box-containing protein